MRKTPARVLPQWYESGVEVKDVLIEHRGNRQRAITLPSSESTQALFQECINPAMSPPQTYRLAQILGTGAYGLVFKAIEPNSGRTVALKKSRVSQRVKRPVLQYESRVLQLLQGHPAIPTLYGYGHLPHFEYLAMELLGPSLKDCATAGRVAASTVVRVVLQMLSTLDHIHKHGFVHRDIKPENVLSSSTDPSRVILIDFGISRRIESGPPTKYDPLKESRHIVGTLHWASLNSHDGIDLRPRDDLESLAYTALFLLRGDLPWRSFGSQNESRKSGMQRIRASKAAASGGTLGDGFPAEFGYLLDYSRGLEYDQMPDYEGLKRRFADLNGREGGKDVEGPLDWSSIGTSISEEHNGSVIDRSDTESDTESDEGDDEEKFENSYFNWDIADWEIQGARDQSLTLPIEHAELADSGIPEIVEVTEEYNV